MGPLIAHARNAATVDLKLAGLTERDLTKLGWTKRKESNLSLFVSDSVFLVYPPDEDDPSGALAVARLAHKVARLIGGALDNDIPLRGAIAYGECFMQTRERPVFLGKPLAEAYQWSESQEWIGAMLAPSAVGALCEGDRDIFRACPNPDLCEYEVPLKENAVRPPLCVAVDWRRSGFWGWKAPELSGNESVSVAKKIENTRRFFDAPKSLA